MKAIRLLKPKSLYEKHFKQPGTERSSALHCEKVGLEPTGSEKQLKNDLEFA